MGASASSWKRNPFVEGIPLPYKANFSLEQLDRLKVGLIPRRMEDKWFIYFDEPHLFLHRSWTGQPVYRLSLKCSSDGAEVTETLWAMEIAESSKLGVDYQVQLLDFLVSNLLLGQAKQFPLPGGIDEPKHGVFQHSIAGTGFPEKNGD
jgi:hypothetical protein